MGLCGLGGEEVEKFGEIRAEGMKFSKIRGRNQMPFLVLVRG